MFDPKNWYKPYGHPETGDLLKLSCGDFEVLWPSICSCATSEMVVWFTGKPLFKPKMWPTGFSLPCFFLGGAIFVGGFQEDESPMAETGGASFSFKLPDGSIREAGSEPALITSKRGEGPGFFSGAWNQKSPIFHRCWWFRISGFYTIQFVVKKTLTTTFDYLRLIHCRWSSLDIWTINTQVLRKIPVEYPIITVLDPKGIVVFPFNRKKPDFEDEFAMGKVLAIPPDQWMFIETSPWPLKYTLAICDSGPPGKTLSSMTWKKTPAVRFL